MKLFELLLESRIDFLRDKYIPLLKTYIDKKFTLRQIRKSIEEFTNDYFTADIKPTGL